MVSMTGVLRDARRTEETARTGRVTRKKMWWVEKGENDY
jgi:hypothetical protein